MLGGILDASLGRQKIRGGLRREELRNFLRFYNAKLVETHSHNKKPAPSFEEAGFSDGAAYA